MISLQNYLFEDRLKECISNNKKCINIEKIYSNLHNQKVLVAKSKERPNSTLIGLKINDGIFNGKFAAIYTDIKQIPNNSADKYDWAYVLFDEIFYNISSPNGSLFFKFDGLVINPFGNKIVIRKGIMEKQSKYIN